MVVAGPMEGVLLIPTVNLNPDRVIEYLAQVVNGGGVDHTFKLLDDLKAG